MLLVIYPKNHCQGQCQRAFPCVSFYEFGSFSFYVQVFNPFSVNFCIWYLVRGQLHSFACGCSVFPAPFAERAFLSPLNSFVIFVEDNLTIHVRASFWASYSIPLVYIMVFITNNAILITLAW